MTDDIREKKNALLEELNRVRPYMRSEYRDMLGDAGIPEMDETLYRERVFDYERAPFVENNGIRKAIEIIEAVSPNDFPDMTIFLFTCLQRIEAYHYELLRPENEPGADENRSLMYKLGVRKAIRKTAGLLPENDWDVWNCRRKMLDVLENELWRIELEIEARADAEKVGKLRLLADSLHAMTPGHLAAFKVPAELRETFSRDNGEPARKLVAYVYGNSE